MTAQIVLVCQVFYPDSQSTSQLFSDLFRVLAVRGFDTTVLCGFPATKGGAAARERWHGIEIRRGGVQTAFKKTLWRRALAYASYSSFVLWSLQRLPHNSNVLIVTNPPFIPVLAAVVCWLRGLRYIIMLQDVFPDGLVAVGALKERGFIDRIWRWANRQAFQRAHEVWTLGRDMADLVARKYDVPRPKIRYVPHWSSAAIARPLNFEDTRLHKELGLHNKLVVQYSGNMGLWHDITTIVRAAELLRHDPRIHFLMIGGGIRRSEAQQLATAKKLTNVSWIGFRPKDELDDSLACCHVALISQRVGLEGIAVPCKLYGILASGRPIVAQVPAHSEVALVIAEENCGRVVPPGNAYALAATIHDLISAPGELQAMGQRAHSAYAAKYTLEAGADAFSRALDETQRQ